MGVFPLGSEDRGREDGIFVGVNAVGGRDLRPLKTLWGFCRERSR